MDDYDSQPILLVDDEPSVLRSTRAVLLGAGVKEVEILADSRQLLDLMGRKSFGLLVLDLFMPFVTGLQLLPEIVRAHPRTPVIVMTAAQDVETAVVCMKEGAFDYLVKPVEESRLVACVRHAVEMRSLRHQMGLLKQYLLTDDLKHGDIFARIITRSRKMRGLFRYVEAIARSSEPVLVVGETGVGKELFADVIHRLSVRKGELVHVNVGGLDDTLFSDTLFGHRKGAFTGADRNRDGLIAQAEGGTLFLDEIGELSMASQVKLLRLIQDQKYYPLGSDMPRHSDARILCATNRGLEQSIAKGQFRSDLFYRLTVHQVDVPPLRERKEDLPLLLCHFLEESARSMDKAAPRPSPELLTLLGNYHFPGNVRELRAMVYNAVAMHREGPILGMESFRQTIQKKGGLGHAGWEESGASGDPLTVADRFPSLKEAEEWLVREALKRANDNQGIAATLLGISRPALNRRLVRMGQPPDSEG